MTRVTILECLRAKSLRGQKCNPIIVNPVVKMRPYAASHTISLRTTNKYPFTRHTPGELGLSLITFKSGCPGCLPNWFSLLHEGFSHALNINKFVLYLQIFKKFRNMQSRYYSAPSTPSPNPPPFLEFPRRTGN